MKTMHAFPATSRLVLCAVALIGFCSTTWAADVVIDPYHEYRDEVGRGEFSYDDSKDVPWIESETEVLAIPDDANLRQVAVDRLPRGLSLWADISRVTVDPKDDVVRLWLVVRSSQGAENGSFEGYRCQTGEYKVYAYSNPARKPPVSKAKRPRWRKLKTFGPPSNYRAELIKDFFCDIRGTRDDREIVQYLTGELVRQNLLSH